MLRQSEITPNPITIKNPPTRRSIRAKPEANFKLYHMRPNHELLPSELTYQIGELLWTWSVFLLVFNILSRERYLLNGELVPFFCTMFASVRKLVGYERLRTHCDSFLFIIR